MGSSEPVLDLKYLIKKVFYKNFVKIYDHVKNHGVEKGLRKLGPNYSHALPAIGLASFSLWFFCTGSLIYKPRVVFFVLARKDSFRTFTSHPHPHVLSTLYYGGASLKKIISLTKPTLLTVNKAEKACLLCKPAYI